MGIIIIGEYPWHSGLQSNQTPKSATCTNLIHRKIKGAADASFSVFLASFVLTLVAGDREISWKPFLQSSVEAAQICPKLFLRCDMSSSKTARTESFSDEPLSASEVTMASGLLLRAVKHGQEQQLMKVVQSAPHAKHLWVKGGTVLSDIRRTLRSEGPGPSSMTDASKRRFDDDDDVQSWEKMSGYHEVPDDATYLADLPLNVEIPPPFPDGSSPLLQVMKEAGSDSSIPFPEKVTTIHAWGNTLCKTDKFAKEKISYYELIHRAKTDTEVCQHLNFIKGRFSYVPGVTPADEKVTPGKDLARFLQKYKWNPSGGSKESFNRDFK